MVSTISALAVAFSLGVTHAFEVDHMTAVTAFVAGKPTPRQAIRFGIQWAVGHGASLLLLGTLLFALKMTVPSVLGSGLERLVGVALLGLGVWTLYEFWKGRKGAAVHQEHTHADGTTHAAHHGSPLRHHHHHSSLWMGMLHGAAGTAAFVGETLVAVSQTYFMVIAYTLAFGLGVLIAMAVYSGALGGILTWSERRSRLILAGARVTTGVAACAVGVYWIIR